MTDTVLTKPHVRFGSLPRALRANGIFSALSGLIALVAAKPVATFLGVSPPVIIAVIGAVLLGFAALLVWLARDAQVDRRWAIVIIELDVAWVIGSVILLLANWVPFTVAGKWTVALLAEVVFWFAVWQYYALRQQKRR